MHNSNGIIRYQRAIHKAALAGEDGGMTTTIPKPASRYAELAARWGLPADAYELLDLLAGLEDAGDGPFLRECGIA